MFKNFKSSKNNIMGVYTITCTTNGKVYVGSSKNVNNRLRNHLSKFRTGKRVSPLLWVDYKLYGPDSFKFEIVFEAENMEDAVTVERGMISEYRALGISYNIKQVYKVFYKRPTSIGARRRI